ncbi:MAG: hypothetical protein O7C65_06830 [Planctomycetota bacterium]|nr:hypothetical protein [Planctomycetota bacterium]
MNIAHQCFVLPLCCLATTIIPAQCEDADARRRDEVQAVITSASRELREATPIPLDPDEEQAAQTRQQLTALVASLSDTSGSEPGQKAAASLLAAGAHRSLAAIALAQAERIEADHRMIRTSVHGMMNTASRLDALVQGLEAVNADTEQAQLTIDRDEAQEQLHENSQQMADLDGPIGELTKKNRDDQAEVDRLRTEANGLRREATDRGRAAGFTMYEQAVQLGRQADRIEYEIALREIELRYEQQPQHNVAQARAEHAQAQIDAIDDAQSSLGDLVQTSARQAETTRTMLAEFRNAIGASIRELNQTASGPLKQLYDRAATQLESAVAKANAAAKSVKGDRADAARIEAARARQNLGRMHWSVAQGLDDHIALRQRLAGAPSIFGSDSGGAESVAELDAAREVAIEQAEAAYTDALDILGSASGRGTRRDVESLRNSIDQALASLSGEEVDWSSVRGSGQLTGSVPTPTRTFATPEALLAYLWSLQSSPTVNLEDFLGLYHAETAEGRRMLGLMQDLDAPSAELQRAMVARFGQSAVQTTESSVMIAGLFAGSNWRITNKTDDRATISSSSPLGTFDMLSLVRVNGSWMIDADDIDETDRQGLAMMQAMLPAMKQAYADLIKRLQAGEFSSPDELIAAQMEAMMRAMGGRDGMPLPKGFKPPSR